MWKKPTLQNFFWMTSSKVLWQKSENHPLHSHYLYLFTTLPFHWLQTTLIIISMNMHVSGIIWFLVKNVNFYLSAILIVPIFHSIKDFRASYDNKRAIYNWYACFSIEFYLKICKNQFKQLIDNFLNQKTWNNLLIENYHN